MEPSPQDCKFFKVFQNFSVPFKVFQCFSGFLSLSSDEGPPPRPFHCLVFFNFKGKIVFGDPPLPQIPTPLERESLPPKTPHMRGTQDRPGSLLKMWFFNTEIDGSGWALVFWVF